MAATVPKLLINFLLFINLKVDFKNNININIKNTCPNESRQKPNFWRQKKPRQNAGALN
jgi:hypothetical protein